KCPSFAFRAERSFAEIQTKRWASTLSADRLRPSRHVHAITCATAATPLPSSDSRVHPHSLGAALLPSENERWPRPCVLALPRAPRRDCYAPPHNPASIAPSPPNA